MNSRPRVLLFDWDNTLVDTWGPIHEALVRTFIAMDMTPWTLEETKARAQQSLRDSFPILFGDRWPDAKAAFYAAFEAVHIEKLAPLAGADTLLPALSNDYLLAVVSNKAGYLLRREAAALGWDRYFHALVGAGDAVQDKPDRAPVDLALAGTGFLPGPDVWFIGDTKVDIDCARASGCVPVLMEGAPDTEPDPTIEGVARRFVSLDALGSTLLPVS